MNKLLVVALLCTAVRAGWAEGPAAQQALVGQDPLTRQIRRRMLQADGGFSSVTWVKSANGRHLAVPLPGALTGLKVEGGLLVDGSPKPAEGKARLKKAKTQLEHVEKKLPAWSR